MSIGDWESKEFRKEFDPALPFQTRDGREAKLCENLPNGSISVFVKDCLNPGGWRLITYPSNGSMFFDLQCGNDLVNTPPKKIKKEGWINIYPCSNNTGLSPDLIARQSGVFNNKESAEKWATAYQYAPHPAATIKIEWEEEE